MNRLELNKWYFKSYEDFDNSVKKAIITSKSVAGILETPRRAYATVLFTRITVLATSLLKLAPKELSPHEHYDFASIASIARNILECYLFMYYFSVEEISDDEWQARLFLTQLHDCISRIELFQTLEKIEQKPNNDIFEFREQANEIKKNLLKNNFFNTFTEKQKTDFFKGKKVLYCSQDSIVEKLGASVSDYRLHYQIFSRYLHTLPFSFYRSPEDLNNTGGKNDKDIGYTAMTFEYIQGVIENANKDIIKMFPTSFKK
ncbi:MAG: DUF5677 domain-containing protein [Rickettsiales bacterium]|nr:DUF5677 domain-containing protein [Rickettsiales bacterium]